MSEVERNLAALEREQEERDFDERTVGLHITPRTRNQTLVAGARGDVRKDHLVDHTTSAGLTDGPRGTSLRGAVGGPRRDAARVGGNKPGGSCSGGAKGGASAICSARRELNRVCSNSAPGSARGSLRRDNSGSGGCVATHQSSSAKKAACELASPTVEEAGANLQQLLGKSLGKELRPGRETRAASGEKNDSSYPRSGRASGKSSAKVLSARGLLQHQETTLPLAEVKGLSSFDKIDGEEVRSEPTAFPE